MPGYFWPANLSKNTSLRTLAKLFASYGYEECSDSSLEIGFEKIALYVDSRTAEFTYVARQLLDGKWTSKLGPDEDIEHNTLNALEGDRQAFQLCYGQAVRYLKRQIPD